ncbi:MAG: ATPase, partial [Gammaproteobacteria bacterium]|nr:ATPase [Gammaproteobacteria bacterium]
MGVMLDKTPRHNNAHDPHAQLAFFAEMKAVLHHPATAWVILFLSFVLTWAAWSLSNGFIQQRVHERFQFETDDIKSAIERRMAEYESVLRGGAGLFAASTEVTRAEWRAYAESLQLGRFYPGIQGFGVSAAIPPQEKAAHLAKVRQDGFLHYDIHPTGERAFYTSIVYLEPFNGRNLRAFGYDMYTEPVRRTAMARARDTGEPALSGKVRLVQETDRDVQHGVLLYVPVYRPGMPIRTEVERRDALFGFVYSPFRMNDLMRGILGSGHAHIELEIFDGDRPSEAALLYHQDNLPAHFGRLASENTQQRTLPIRIAGQTWTLFMHARPGYLSTGEQSQPLVVAVGGVIIDLLLFFIIASIGR